MVTLAFQETDESLQQPQGRKTIWLLKVIELLLFTELLLTATTPQLAQVLG